MSILNLSNISFNYSNQIRSNEFNLEGVNLSVNEGEFISLLGPNGSGKSTLIKIAANILVPNNGVRQLFSKDYSAISRKKFAQNVAFVPQNTGTNFPYSLYEIVMMGRSPYLNILGIEGQSDHELVLETLALLEIDHLRAKGINEVSGGEAQRALIARAIVQKPKILLLDEPSAHLDVKHQLSIFNLLREFYTDRNLTVLTITHDLNLANHYSDRSILMSSGQIKYDASPQNILTESNIKDIFGVQSKIILDSQSNRSFISLIN